MIIKVERFGGLAGIRTSIEMDAKDLPIMLVTKAKKIMKNSNSSLLPLKSRPKGAADDFTYKISVQDGAQKSVIECNQFEIHDDLKLLISYMEKNSKKKS